MTPNSPYHKRILLVSPYLPFPPESGGIQRTYFLWKALSEIAPVDVVLCNDPYKPGIGTSLIPASMNFLGRFPWQPKGYSLHRLFENIDARPDGRSPAARGHPQALGL